MASDSVQQTLECSVCYEDCTENNKIITCPKCDTEACRLCWQRNFIELQGATPYCINVSCEFEFSIEFIFKNFPKDFIKNDLRNHHMKEYYNVQKEKLKNYLHIIKRTKINESIDTDIAHLRDKKENMTIRLKKLDAEINNLCREKEYNFPIIIDQLPYPDDLVDLYQSGNRKPLREWFKHNKTTTVKSENTKHEIKYHYKCPENGCNGFLDGKFKCGLCCNYFCEDCFEFIGKPSENVKLSELRDIHVCKPDNKSSFDMIKESTQPCPKCRTRIHKSEGCRQMWCIVCHTTFDYYTGKIETGVIHNPHYYEFMKNQKTDEPREVELCHGEIVEMTSIKARLNRNNPTNDDKTRFKIIERYHSLINEINQYVLIQYEVRTEVVERYIQEQGVAYLLEKITEDTFRERLYKNELNNEKRRRLRQIFDLFVTVGADTINSFYQLMDNQYSSDIINSTIDQLNNLVRYCNEMLNGSIEALCFKIHPIFHISDFNYVTLFSSNKHSLFLSNKFKHEMPGNARNAFDRHYRANGDSYI